MKVPVSKVYAALSTVEGVAGWWTEAVLDSGRKGFDSWPRVLSSMKSFLETGKRLNVCGGR